MRRFILIILFSLSTAYNWGQGSNKKQIYTVLPNLEIEGHYYPYFLIDEVYVIGQRKFKNQFEAWKYQRLIKNLKIVYPYAVMARQKFTEMLEHYNSLQSEREKKKYINQIEKEILDQYGDELKKLTVSQGKLLIKLIDRELGSTSYDVVKDYKGTFSAVFWQTLAKLFGSNLKVYYDPEGEDKIIEDLIFLYKQGLL